MIAHGERSADDLIQREGVKMVDMKAGCCFRCQIFFGGIRTVSTKPPVAITTGTVPYRKLYS